MSNALGAMLSGLACLGLQVPSHAPKACGAREGRMLSRWDSKGHGSRTRAAKAWHPPYREGSSAAILSGRRPSVRQQTVVANSCCKQLLDRFGAVRIVPEFLRALHTMVSRVCRRAASPRVARATPPACNQSNESAGTYTLVYMGAKNKPKSREFLLPWVEPLSLQNQKFISLQGS